MLTKKLPAAVVRPSRRTVVVRASSVNVTFKIHRHVEYGQSLLIIGSGPELGAWDSTKAVPLEWGEGDNWTAKLTLPVGASAEYKYIIKRKDALDWSPGQNKQVTLPAAAAVEVSDSWEHSTSSLAVTTPAETAAEPSPAAPMIVAEAPAPVLPVVAEAAPAPTPVAPIVAEAAAPVHHHEISPEAVERADHRAAAVSTVENIEAEELDATLAPPAPAPAPISGSASSAAPAPGSGSFLANNIVQAAPKGAIALGAADPMHDYEEADKFQVVEVGAGAETSSGTATATLKAAAPAAAAKKSLDGLTVSELKSELKRRGLSSLGTRRELITRLQQAGL
ncbi:hypothetical protein HYH02_015358 [Chlamydomonas schloesseri]|uniref:CBM20 domain-containing protein n=1 Tax=Chlamydomonas schloesseri TaxID=2026947 RepID=A0A835SEH6_9CHLO|nr:hypothetical protein HYH02_015358 [Chlamydomonas schloesseri]|eukprot:KAG2423257.1 hypothetical protein HYH02_015358 [Chlamydomonas schloesseri]